MLLPAIPWPLLGLCYGYMVHLYALLLVVMTSILEGQIVSEVQYRWCGVNEGF